MLGLCCCAAFSLVVVGMGFSSCGVQASPVVASLTEEHRLQVEQASVAAVSGL